MGRLAFLYEITHVGGIELRLQEKPWIGRGEFVPVDAWADRMAHESFSGLSRVLALADDAESPVERRGEALFLDDETIASLSEPQALGLGLPPSSRHVLQVNTRNLITDMDFSVTYRWVDETNRPCRAERQGAFISVSNARYRLPQPLFSLLKSIDNFATADTRDDSIRMERLAELQSLLPHEAADQLTIDRYFSSFRIAHASAFSLSLNASRGAFNFDPILFGRRILDRTGPEGSPASPVSETESVLTENQQAIFAKERFRSTSAVKPSYLIERGVFLYLDPMLQSAMTVVRRMQQGDAETRKRFVQAPQLYLKEALASTLAEDEIERIFVETEQYSARITGIGVWTPPVIPWIKREPNSWLPERFGLQVGGVYLELKPDDVAPLRDAITTAKQKGEEYVEFGEQKIRVPTSEETERSLAELMGAISPSPALTPIASPTTPEPNEPLREDRHVLLVEENFDSLGFTKKATPRGGPALGTPTALRPSLMKHQSIGLQWIQQNWLNGRAGVLLADDMGLGKTLQALSFLSWLKESRQRSGLKRPVIIVAPTGLLANWGKEHDQHLHEPGLGEICRAYGRHLQVLKIPSEREVDRGGPALDHRRMQQADWVLTTYETLRDHHLSFASIPFACAVFDEMQKVKSPSSLLTRAAKTLNADFILGLTGTPIENELSDLWCIVDIITPGFLGDLKEFSKKYLADDDAAMVALHNALLSGQPGAPSAMLRRLKSEELDGLPTKQIHIRRRNMPSDQARIYANLVSRAKDPASGPMLETLHMLRGVSLHPIWPPAGEIKDPRAFIEQSARLTETFAILDEIASRKEKALIFLESLDLQEHLALMIKTRYGLQKRPMQINGEVAGDKRQALVDQFQQHRGAFDVMILSPRAGGVGLTLTSANHVIHLSRWWNPAVEDQCTDRVYRIGQDRTVHVYYPMAIHPAYGESSFDALLNTLLIRKRDLSARMFVPPVNAKRDQDWFAENLGRMSPNIDLSPIDIDEVDSMEPIAFERWVLARCISLGWEASRTPKSYDGGADGVLVHRASGARAIVQCKHTQVQNAPSGSEAIDDLLRSRAHYPGDARLFVVSNAARFSRSTIERAERFKIELVGRTELLEWPRQLLS
ncbi:MULTISPECIES: SNF2-related protein [unclassified Bradyrhizobium]|uniref:SNF2-related protein n=1 Tax=unclassified Bradyrhizobium TaxID=2631580 RepID=UPI002FF28D41